MNDAITRFPTSRVSIDDTEYLAAQQAGAQYLLHLNPDRLLYPFRREAGIPQPTASNGETILSYPNWEATGLDGHIAGHYLSACVAFAQALAGSSTNNIAAAVNSTAFIQRAAHMVRDMCECQQAFSDDETMRGYIGGIPNSRSIFTRIARGDVESQNFALNGGWVPIYNLHKTFAGLLDAWEGLACIDADTSIIARRSVIELADWWCRIAEPLSDEIFERILVSEFGGMCESFAELYARTGNERYRRMAYRFCDATIFEPLSRGEDTLTGMHANTQIPKVLGWERLGALCGDDTCNTATNAFWNSVVHHRSISIGAHSVSEHFHPADDFSSMVESREGPETCNSYNMSKLAERLWLREPKPEYLDFYERVLENHLLSTVNPEHPGFVYFTPMRPDHYRAYSTSGQCFWCCVGSGLENHARYGRLVFARQHVDGEPERLLCNLLIGATLDWAEEGIAVRQTVTRSNADGGRYVAHIRIHADDARTHRLIVCVRDPWWAADFSIEVVAGGVAGDCTAVDCVVDDCAVFDGAAPEGGASQLASLPEGYRAMRLEWRGETEIRVLVKPRVSVELLPDGSAWASFMVGPKVMALRGDDQDLIGQFADDSRMGHIAAGPLRASAELPIIVAGDADGAGVAGAPSMLGQARLDMENKRLSVPALDSRNHLVSLELEPFTSIHESRYSVYLPIAPNGDVDGRRQELAQADAEQMRHESSTIDAISCGQQQSEVDHEYCGQSDDMGADGTIHWRRTAAEGCFGYTMRRPSDGGRLEVSLCVDDADMPYALSIDDVTLKRVERRVIDGDPLCADIYDLATAGDASRIAVRIAAAGRVSTPRISVLRVVAC